MQLNKRSIYNAFADGWGISNEMLFKVNYENKDTIAKVYSLTGRDLIKKTPKDGSGLIDIETKDGVESSKVTP